MLITPANITFLNHVLAWIWLISIVDHNLYPEKEDLIHRLDRAIDMIQFDPSLDAETNQPFLAKLRHSDLRQCIIRQSCYLTLESVGIGIVIGTALKHGDTFWPRLGVTWARSMILLTRLALRSEDRVLTQKLESRSEHDELG